MFGTTSTTTTTPTDRKVGRAHQPWTEKYRPKTVDDVSSQGEVVEALKTALATGMMPHLLFYGPPGTGKTSTILALAKEMFGANFKQRVLELNASDERGISIIREKVKSFAQTAVSTNDGGPGFKLIILDEADAMTGDAQSALRRTMEKYTRVTRFCLICNYVSRIIEPLASRCAKFRFRTLPRAAMLDRLQFICQNESVDCDEEGYDSLIDASGGDMRRAVTLLQSAANYNSQIVDRLIVYEVAGILPENALKVTWSAIKAGLYDGVASAVKEVLLMGYSSTMMTSQLLQRVMLDPELSDYAKAEMLLKLANTDKNLVDGADEELQMMDVCCHFAQICKKSKKSS